MAGTPAEEDEPLVSPDDQDEFRRRAIRAALAVVGIAAVIGLVIGGLTAAAVYMTGLAPDDEGPAPTVAEPAADDEEALPTPSLSPTTPPTPATSADPSQAPTTSAAPSPGPSRTPSPNPTRSRKPQRDQPIQLNAGASSVASYERVTLSGRYPGGDGTTLQVQRREGGSWASFPTSATVDGGSFSTYVASGQPGRNEFRVVDPATGQASNVVVFTVS